MSTYKDELNKSNHQEPEQENVYGLVVKFGFEIMQGNFTSIPNFCLDLYLELGITYAEMMFIIHVWHYWYKAKRDAFPALTSIAEKMGVSRRQVQTYASNLRNKKFTDKENGYESKTYLQVKERYQEGKGQLSSIYDFSGFLEAVVYLAKKNGLLVNEEDAPWKSTSRGGMKSTSIPPQKSTSTEEYKVSNNTNLKNTKHISKGQSPFSQKGTGNGSTPARSHIASSTIGNQGTKRSSKPSNGEASKASTRQPKLTQPPITQDEIDRNRRRGRNTSGFRSIGDLIGVPQGHLFELNQQFHTPPESIRQKEKSGKQGNWKKAPLFIQAMIADWFSLELHDQAVHSTITSVYKIFQQWRLNYEKDDLTNEQAEDAFRNIMYEARARAKRANITTRTPDGRPNRTPFFKTALEDLCGLREKGSAYNGLANDSSPN